jgi:hypothetical protein
MMRNCQTITGRKPLHPFTNRFNHPNQFVAQRDGPL